MCNRVSVVMLVFALLVGGAPAALSQEQAPNVGDLIAGKTSTSEPAKGDESSDEPPGATPRSAVRAYLEAAAAGDYEAAARYLSTELSEVESANLARHLEVVLDKTLWIDLSKLSADAEGDRDDDLPASRDRIGAIEVDEREVPVLLARSRAGQEPAWRFAPETVAQIPALYEVYGYGPLGTYLPDFFFDTRLFDIQLWQWLGLILLVVVAGILSWAIASLAAIAVRRTLQRKLDETAGQVAAVVTGPARLAIGVTIFSGTKHLLGLALSAVAVLNAIEGLLLVVAVSWAALRLVEVFSSLVERRLRERNQASAITLLSPGRKALKAFVLVVGLLAALDTVGFNVTAVLAGLGVGGIAVALAAQKTVENLFGGATLYADRPVRVGDFCRFGDKVGTVEDVGLRSTRVRTLDRTVVAIPNADFANLQLENFTSRDKIWYHPRIGLRYETTPDQLRYILVEVRKMLYAHPSVDSDPARIRFTNFGAYSLDLDVYAYVKVTDYGEFLEVAEDLNLRIMDIVKEAGSGFAFPSQTTYIEQGEPLDPKRQEQVGESVTGWRDERELYLPRFPEDKIRELRGTLDFPPRGSPFGRNGGSDR